MGALALEQTRPLGVGQYGLTVVNSLIMAYETATYHYQKRYRQNYSYHVGLQRPKECKTSRSKTRMHFTGCLRIDRFALKHDVAIKRGVEIGSAD